MEKFIKCVIFFFIASLSYKVFAQPQAHKHMTVKELRRTFQVSNHESVPEYEVINIHSVRRSKRNSESVHLVNLETHGRKLQLELSKNRHLLPSKNLEFWYADAPSSKTTNISYTKAPRDSEEIGDAYQDENNQAAVLLFKDKTDDSFLMDGIIDDDLIIKPLSQFVKAKLLESDNFSFQNFTKSFDENDDYALLNEVEDIGDEDVMVDSSANNYPYLSRRHKRSVYKPLKTGTHVVYKRKYNEKALSDYHIMENHEENESIHEEVLSRSKRQAPYYIFPEILCVVDYDGYRLHGKDNVAIKRYVISFWNGIDLRYKLLKSPSVKISIAGIIISRGRDATPYLERNRVGHDSIDSASALTDMGKYLFLERRLPVYDIAVAITKLDMCRRKSRHGDCNRGTAGFAYVGGACVVNKRLEKVNSVAIVEDTGGFSGIIVAAHELGHLLGAVHDGSPPPSYLGGPGARKCLWEDGFIMSDLRHTSKGFRWSHCSINQFHHFLNGETATCMYNSPHAEESLPKVLPGKLLTLDAQCRKDRGTSACFKDDRVCAQLFCFDSGSGYCVSYRPAAEGSPCGDGKICIDGKCIYEDINSIESESDDYVRRSGSIFIPSDGGSGGTTTTTSSSPSTNSPLNFPPIARPLPPQPSLPPTTTTALKTSTSTTPTTTNPIEQLTSRTLTTSLTTTATRKTTTIAAATTTTTTTTLEPITTTSDPISNITTRTYGRIQLKILRTVSKISNREIKTKNSKGMDDDTTEHCQDRISNIAGSLSCKAFLRSFAYQYCRHKYIKKNCCVSHKVFCSGSRGGLSSISNSER